MKPCYADPQKLRFRAVFFRDVSPMFPYLNAEIPNALYNTEADTLTFVKEGRVVNLYPREMSVIKAINTTDAHRITDYVREMLNDVHRRRCDIEPLYERRRLPSVLDILAVLPGDDYNCGECGELTCLAFAAMLLSGERQITDCRPLSLPENHDLQKAIINLLGRGPLK